MRNRVIFGILVGVIAVITIYLGGIVFKSLLAFIIAWGSYEFTKARKRDINWFEWLAMTLFCFLLLFLEDKAVALVTSLLVILCTLAVFDEKISFEDICVTFLESLLLGFSVKCANDVVIYNRYILGYIVICAMVTDVFAFFSGKYFGKHKLNERVSPKKTIEGSIGGWICGGAISFVYISVLNFCDLNPVIFILGSIILPVVSMVGDLTFSLIKRNYGIKDYSNLIPGHGGLLDRLDSTLFTLLIYGALTIFL